MSVAAKRNKHTDKREERGRMTPPRVHNQINPTEVSAFISNLPFPLPRPLQEQIEDLHGAAPGFEIRGRGQPTFTRRFTLCPN
ncbi:hypothetical protein F2P81_001003 [Scophthalmus maximus]|uniref:Uncharacterized protein n=1 Tax=Scophthalmus maximus TaxID=52904 RepID=A0A6A4TUQ0_SCOMX|nr:hypothetical protein F2P81_001003 [Scophthalmus maximus]